MEIRPQLCVILSFRSIFEFTIQKICRELNVKQVYLEHGLFTKDSTAFNTKKGKSNIIKTIKRQLVFIYQYLTFIFFKNKILNNVTNLYRFIVKGNFSCSPFDKYLLYSKRSFDLLSPIFPLDKGNTILVGYPFFSNEKSISQLNSIKTEEGGVLYVHQPFILDKATNINYDDEKKYINNIASYLSKSYSSFTILLHPRENIKKYLELYSNTSIRVIQSPNNFRCFTDKSLILGHYSTALLYALYFSKPTFIIDYPNINIDKTFCECFTYIKNISEIDENKISSIQKEANREYFIGNYFTYEHIASILVNI